MIKKQYDLEGLCCGNCATKIEQDVAKISTVKIASVDFISKILTIEVLKEDDQNSLEKQILAVIKRHDSQIKMREIESLRSGQKAIYLFGLCCGDCAGKIEAQVNKLPGVKMAQLDFVSQKLTVEVEDKAMLPTILRQASNIATDIEPAIRISYSPDQKAEDKSELRKKWIYRVTLWMGAALYIVGMLTNADKPATFFIFALSYLFVGGEVVFRALKNILKGQMFDENFLMSIATIGAFAIGEYPEGVAVMLFYQIGEMVQRIAVNRSRKSISMLMDIRPDFAHLKIGNEIQKVAPEEVSIGDFIVVKPGEKIPLDGIVADGISVLDTSALTGESLPRDVGTGDDVLSGSINKNGVLTIEVTKEFGESTVSKILDLVQNASSKKAPTETFITKFARYYTPFITFAALALAVIPPLIIPGATVQDWIYRALAFLVVSCPCALVISIPLSFFGGIGGASKNGILVKGSNYLEALNSVDAIVFDKTGTLTKGVFSVTQLESFNGWDKDELLFYAAYAESFSNHPIARSIVQAYGQEIDSQLGSNQQEIAGHGIKVTIKDHLVLAGNSRLMDLEKIIWKAVKVPGTIVHLAIDGIYAGYMIISDEIKPDSKRAIDQLKSLGIKEIIMLTGDSKLVGETIAKELGITKVYSELLPHQKVEQLERIQTRRQSKGKLAFVGDGINDAPVLARADIGIAMGALGSDAAIEAADIVLMTDEPSKIVSAIKVARKTRTIVWQNILFAMGIKLIVLALAAFGLATMWEAVFGDVGVTIVAIINATRTMKTIE